MATLGNLRINLVEGEFKHDHDIIGKQDPYVLMKCRE